VVAGRRWSAQRFHCSGSCDGPSALACRPSPTKINFERSHAQPSPSTDRGLARMLLADRPVLEHPRRVNHCGVECGGPVVTPNHSCWLCRFDNAVRCRPHTGRRLRFTQSRPCTGMTEQHVVGLEPPHPLGGPAISKAPGSAQHDVGPSHRRGPSIGSLVATDLEGPRPTPPGPTRRDSPRLPGLRRRRFGGFPLLLSGLDQDLDTPDSPTTEGTSTLRPAEAAETHPRIEVKSDDEVHQCSNPPRQASTDPQEATPSP